MVSEDSNQKFLYSTKKTYTSFVKDFEDYIKGHLHDYSSNLSFKRAQLRCKDNFDFHRFETEKIIVEKRLGVYVEKLADFIKIYYLEQNNSRIEQDVLVEAQSLANLSIEFVTIEYILQDSLMAYVAEREMINISQKMLIEFPNSTFKIERWTIWFSYSGSENEEE